MLFDVNGIMEAQNSARGGTDRIARYLFGNESVKL